MLNQENKTILIKRFKTFLWTVGNILAISGIDFLATNAELFDLSPLVILLIGSFTAQITKHLNSK